MKIAICDDDKNELFRILSVLADYQTQRNIEFSYKPFDMPGESEPLLPPLLQLTRVHNYGAAWSSFSGARWLLIALTATGMCAIAWLLVKIVRHPLGQWSLAIILGGGIGNLIDRVRLGYVVDMLDTMFMDFPVFNVADVFVVCGTVCALIYYLAFYSKSDEKNWGNKVDGTDPAANK